MGNVFDKAVEILTDGRVRLDGATREMVWGEVVGSAPDERYVPWVNHGGFGCQCMSFVTRKKACKHLVAVLMMLPGHELIKWVLQDME